MADQAAILEQIKSTQRTMVKELRDAVKSPSFNIPKPALIMFGKESSEGYWRYLEQSGWDLESAIRLLQSAYEWQTKMGPAVAGILKDTFTAMPGCISLRQVGFDKTGRPVLYYCFAQNHVDPSSLTVDVLIAHFAHIAENAGKSNLQANADDVGRKSVLLVDCSGFSQNYLLKPDMLLKVYQTLCLIYPCVLESVMVLNYGQEVLNSWRSVKDSFDGSFGSKFRFVPNTTAAATLSEEFGLELCQWLQAELKLNKDTPLSASQRAFYKKNASHDPRGDPIYVSKYVDRNGYVEGHKPHAGILFGPK